MYEDLLLKAVDYALQGGAKLVVARFHEKRYEIIVFDGGSLREYNFTVSSGIGVDVYKNGRGYSFTTSANWEEVKKTVDIALKLSTLSELKYKPVGTKGESMKYKTFYKVDPFSLDPEDKIKIISAANSKSIRREGIPSAITRMAFESDYRMVVTSEGIRGESLTLLSGFSHTSIAKHSGVLERVGDSKTFEGGYEAIESTDWDSFIEEIDMLAIKAAQARTPPPGSQKAIIDNELVGVVIHEALGHASEGDLVARGASIVGNLKGSRVASSEVTIVDSGVVEGGYPLPFDDEGIVKRESIIVENGILKGFLTSRTSASKLGLQPTGNARAENYDHETLVRQSNFYIKPGDWKVDELFEGFTGLYIRGKGMVGGGQVDVGNGAFSFMAGPSYIVKNGEITEMVRGVSIAGNILEFLGSIEAVANDLKIETSVFGGCGKNGQLARVGIGGPHIKVGKVVVGGIQS